CRMRGPWLERRRCATLLTMRMSVLQLRSRRFRPRVRRPLLLEQLHHGPRLRLVAQADRDRRAAGGADVGDPPRLPVGVPDHVADDGDLLDHALVHAVGLERMAMAMRAQQALRKHGGLAGRATPDADAIAHSARSRMAAPAVPP